MAKCKVCGFRLADKMKKCPMCGAIAGSTKAGNIAKDANLLKYLCPSCKAEIISEHRYCPHCGIELKEAAKRAVSAADKGKILKLAADYLKLKKNRVLAWGVLGLDALTALFFIFQGKQRKEEHGNSEELTYAERNTKQDTVIISKPTVDNAANALSRIKETSLEAFRYEIRDDKYILTGLKDTTLTDIVIPSVFSEIGEEAFKKCEDLTNVTISDSISIIADSAFYKCSDLTNITIPNSVTKIGRSTFSFCSGLKTVTIPDSATKIDEYAFYGCESLTNITIPNSVTKIGESTFSFCSGLKTVIIPDSVTKIGEGAFYGCARLTDVTIPKSVKIIGEYAFAHCNSLKNVSFENPNITKSDIKRVFGNLPSFKEIKIGNKVVYLN
ncbi:leucine-rich repeat protein [Treponema sp. OMZ 787]|uniref:leucine-rich repeat protein n=1 Tax=Treponema sp. OMZ 787 TaxID=2563669 RepID=UPI0020A5038C|nr:leucine-rich repeat protein [Treponema sp. OMZ 787]UTC63037.1 leucine-rich repeat protein [Treponema sp. OMZ 787]